ncbi:MAG: hypothetical protein CBC79_05830 [Gammaproteobacteria bacterium TMED119]|nr:MAG: hypothetical protein CBC79_05830 [Gammaproteobacteria bacterium TMED119]RCL46416.1 MAG: hypothetical protein DBW91_02355 [Candidatus Thioglobus sp.]
MIDVLFRERHTLLARQYHRARDTTMPTLDLTLCSSHNGFTAVMEYEKVTASDASWLIIHLNCVIVR